MGRDLRLYPKKATKAELVSLVKSFDNVRPSSHWWDWPKGTVHFLWFDDTDYRSTTGVEITIFPTRGEQRTLGSSEWAMHVRNTYSATWHDVEMLNKILRTGRKRFGGVILGDYGKNRYAPLWDDTSTPMSRGLAWVSTMAHNNVRAVLHALPDELDVPGVDMELDNFVKSMSPSRVIYNGLVPFLVSVLELYLKSVFVIGLKYDSSAQGRITNYFQEAGHEAPLRGRAPEELIADSVSFQDLRNVKKVFKKWLEMDIKTYLARSEPTSTESLWQRLDDLIKYRHDIIHRMGVDTGFTRAEFMKQAQLVEEALHVLLSGFADKYQMDIESIEVY